MNEASTLFETYGQQVEEKMFYKNPDISYKHKGWFSKLFSSLDISLFVCKKLPYNFDLVHSIDTIPCSSIGR